MSFDSEDFGQRKPPLSVTIRGILDRYPDGQIFKEMIQNADDAEAKSVWFYIDEREHGTSSLPHDALQQFQGPALVSANDACFTAKDWKGIQSLQQSVKADDPFKVGRFGIGFNSVYHITDLPIIVSGNRMAFCEPQEEIWRHRTGCSFKLVDLVHRSPNIVAPLNGLANFNDSLNYPHTIFRLPLRTQPSAISDSVYTIKRLTELLDALREEAKFLLLFLKSVDKIEVIHVCKTGHQSLYFRVEINKSDRATIRSHRKFFLQKLHVAHNHIPYRITETISFSATFSIVVTDNNLTENQEGTSKWIVSNHVGSPEMSVQEAAEKQKTFPWVGTALELESSDLGGRIFCFLPMPIETSSGLPVHIHGTFSLNDERRTLKWPSVERRNDPTANWNKILVSQLLPLCYSMLLLEFKKDVSPDVFYRLWPVVSVVQDTQFMEILGPLFSSLFKHKVISTKMAEAPHIPPKWIPIHEATFSQGSSLPSAVHQALANCKVNLVTVPSNIQEAIHYSNLEISEVSPQLARDKLRGYPGSYANIDPCGKRELIQYCLSDECYLDLRRLRLLPLANNTFTTFDMDNKAQRVYLCTPDCPRSLLPNLDHLLVEISDDQNLYNSLSVIAASQHTKLMTLTEIELVKLLPQAMPPEWKGKTSVVMPNKKLPTTWLEEFWNWLRDKELSLFENKLIIPVLMSTQHNRMNFHLTKLSAKSSVFSVRKYDRYSSSVSALYELEIMIFHHDEFYFVEHIQLESYLTQLDTNEVLDAIGQYPNYPRVTFTQEQAVELRKLLNPATYTPNPQRRIILVNLCIFSSASNSSSQLYSIEELRLKSVASIALGEPERSAISTKYLPPNLILLSRSDCYQLQLLKCLEITFPSDSDLLSKFIFPMILKQDFPDQLIDGLMMEVIDAVKLTKTLTETIHSLPFLHTVVCGRREAPKDLYDPSIDKIKALYKEEDVFPIAPFNTDQRLQVLRCCGLKMIVSPQQIIDIVYSISANFSEKPVSVSSTSIDRAKAIFEYTSSGEFQRQKFEKYYEVQSKMYSYTKALLTLAKTRNWLPVKSKPPQGYPRQLPWKGLKYTCHFISSGNSHTLHWLVGSQMFITDTPENLKMTKWFPTDLGQYIVAHFKILLESKDELLTDMNSLIHNVYSFVDSNTSYAKQLYTVQKWIFLTRENKFVSPAVIALRPNRTFRQNLEPYVYILPDTLSQYKNLFGLASGISPSVTQSQILMVLKLIDEESHTGVDRSSVQEAWSTVMNILNWITDYGTRQVDRNKEVLVPIESASEWPCLIKASDAVYTDNDFMKKFSKGRNEKGESYKFVHNRINCKLAKSLHVVPLTEYLDISEDAFEDAGQYEPLTVRLKNILSDYKDGLTIIKELLQNADDAEATEVNICYDTRQHTQDRDKLLYSGMAKAHGPALVVHNNKAFSKDDFVSITKLAGATKQNMTLKIGKFGLGFCSVYHMTDIPSFVSQDRLYIFDPTLSFLKEDIKNFSQPGKKISYTNQFIVNSEQLSPYDGLFGFDRTRPYQGTMFRFPFRTRPNELSQKCYTLPAVKKLIDDIHKSSSSLLLFLQHVRCINFQRIDQGETSPSLILRVTQENVDLPITLPDGLKVRESFCYQKSIESTSNQKWLVSQQNQTDDLKRYSTATVACPLVETDTQGCYKTDQSFMGEIFCFLPMGQETGLPAHVSSNFAVISNRRGIWTSDDNTSMKAKSEDEVQWNVNLMKGVIPKAYHALLCALKLMKMEGIMQGYVFHSLWPLKENLKQRNPWHHMIIVLYQKICSNDLFFSAYTNQWLQLQDSKFLKPGILCQSSEMSIPKCTVEVAVHLKLPIVDLPKQYKTNFNLQSYVIGNFEFYKLFFKNLKFLEVIPDIRCEVIRHMLELYAAGYGDEITPRDQLDAYLNKYPYIPCTPDGTILRLCRELVDPNSTFYELFEPRESRFPIDKLVVTGSLSYIALCKLGMIKEKIPLSMLIERAQTIYELYSEDKIKALKRVKLILLSLVTVSQPFESFDDNGTSLSDVPFLPVLPKPSEYHLSWRGQDQELKSGRELMTRYGKEKYDNIAIAGSQAVFVNELSIEEGGFQYTNPEMYELLDVRNTPKCEEVIEHFKEVILNFHSQQKDIVACTDRMCRHIYDYLDRQIEKDNNIGLTPVPKEFGLPSKTQWSQKIQTVTQRSQKLQTVIQGLHDTPCIWTGKVFINIDVVAEQWKRQGPYLFQVPSSLSSHESLKTALGIRKKFSFNDLQTALVKMKQDYGETPVNELCQKFLKYTVSLLWDLELDSDPRQCTIMLPDEHYVLHNSTELFYNDIDWFPKDKKNPYVNEIIPISLAKQLQVKPARSNLIEQYISKKDTHFSGVPFGQHEALTQRIQNILRDYPFDITVLKELLQNADDAKATKVYIILDKRTHGKTGILSENWEELQGPALLVWNDSNFSEKDLQGIQELGMGSKRSDSESIGQYGIGFNVVYHLTDCPSFITGGETMCILDPHCKYVIGADGLNPGRRFDKLNSGFWNDFPQMKSAYLQGGLDNCPPELLTGSLFRFPLRHKDHHMRESKIVQKDTDGLPSDKPLTATDMDKKIQHWAPEMKDAMLFLNHVTELRFMRIEESVNTLLTMNSYRTKIEPSDQESRELLLKNMSAFNEVCGNESCVIRYPLTISEVVSTTKKGKEITSDKKWFIQQGIGDLENKKQIWSFVKTVKPRHGIAAPIPQPPKLKAPSTSSSSVISETSRSQCKGKVFCFLPLPEESGLPVHINGNFILDSNRRHLWKSTESEREDDKSVWNRRIFEAIASSYATLLENMKPNHFKTLGSATAALEHYYNIFPTTTNKKKQYQILTQKVYEKLLAHNSSVFAVISKTLCQQSTDAGKSLVIEWHPAKSESPSTQIYFSSFEPKDGEEQKQIELTLEKIGMKLTVASLNLLDWFNKVTRVDKDKLPIITPKTVFEYYTHFSSQVRCSGQFPCSVTDTIFKTVAVFKRFTEYILSDSTPNSTTSKCTHQVSTTTEAPTSFFSHPLLLTADRQLRIFHNEAKVIQSQFSQLFSLSQDKFLHPEMLDVRYRVDYFLQSSSSSDKEFSLQLVKSILKANLPPQLENIRLCAYELYLSKKKLCNYWQCFTTDPIFQLHICEVLDVWALLPTKSGNLYSYKDKLVPIKPVDTLADREEYKYIHQTLLKVGLPFLDTDVVVAMASLSCPCMSDHKTILKTLYNLNQESTLSTLLNDSEVDILLHYLKQIDFRNDLKSLKHVKSLPLFKTIDGSLTWLEGRESYVWPNKASTVAVAKWKRYYPTTVFLDECATWTTLGSPGQLQIGSLCAEEVYYRYIFKEFSKLNKDERYKHLTHIRDNLFKINIHSEIEAIFLESLRNLACLGEHDTLKYVRDYCNHELELFTTFKKHFKFLPDYFTSDKSEWDKWLKFFKVIGLRHTISKDEYLLFCKETANGENYNVVQAAQVLLRYLVFNSAQKVDWHKDQVFLQQVADIAFVPAETLPKLSWIRKVVCPSKMLMINGENFSLTQLNKAGVFETSALLWTIKPIVRLENELSTKHQLLKRMGVTLKPLLADVMLHITNICGQEMFTSFKLFDKYPHKNQPPTNGTSLMKVIVDLLKFLQSAQMVLTETSKATLCDLPCIPVYSTEDKTHSASWQVVLVKPKCVLSCSVSGYHPFLHQLPHDLSSVILLLQEIGMKSVVDLSHIQLVLEMAYKCSSGQELETTTKRCVFIALKTLIKSLSSEEEGNSEKFAKVLSPLYLPTDNNKVALSTNLLYIDDDKFKGNLMLKLEGTTHFMLKVQSMNPWINILEKEFCTMLPKEVRPRGLSELCSQSILNECEIVADSKIAKSLKKTFGMQHFLAEVIAKYVSYLTEDSSFSEAIESDISNFISNIKIITLKHLRISVTFKETGDSLGNLDSDFYLQISDLRSQAALPVTQLYLDSRMEKMNFTSLTIKLSEEMISVVKNYTYISEDKLREICQLILEAQTHDEVKHILAKHSIPLEPRQMADSTIEFGKEVPKEWHHRLDQDFENVFHPDEVVGYEVMEDYIIYAQIMHPVLPEGVESFDSIPRTSMRYVIHTSQDDTTGTEVGILELYKIMKGPKTDETLDNDERGLVLYEGETEHVQLRNELRREDIEEIQKKILEQLDEIYRLPEKERDRAIKRLYFKWHPDKNPDNVDIAEKIFKFLNAEITKRKSGKIDRDEWNRTARSHGENLNRERYSYSSDRGGQFYGGGFRRNWSGDSSFGVPPFHREQTRPQRKPEEGRRWVNQAEANFQSLSILHLESQRNPNVCSDVCFMAHQVAEKALKGGKYFVCGLDDMSLTSPNISTHALGLQAERPTETHNLAFHTLPLEKYYLDPRYPNRWPFPQVPADQYTYHHATEAKNHAEVILNIVQAIVMK